MTDLTIEPKWNASINRLERNEFATGGADGNMNIAPRQLAENTFWLKDELEKKVNVEDIPVVAWGNITGDIAAQTDLSNTYFKIADKNTWDGELNTAIANARKQGDFYATTTTDYPNTYIDPNGDMKRSTATFGTAAAKNVGTAAGNVMEVGAFGIGSDYRPNKANPVRQLSSKELKKTQMLSFGDMPSLGYGSGLGWLAFGRHHCIIGSAVSDRVFVSIATDTQTTLPDTSERIAGIKYGEIPIIGISATKDANGFLRDSNSTTETVVADATGNVAVASIQAGVGAPKIAYKKLTGVTNMGSNTPHGLDVNKILSITGTYLSGALYISYTPRWDATEVDIKSISSGNPYKLLITYEV